MFIGKYENSIDSKARLIIPARFREELGGRVVVSQAIDRCLTITPVAEWEKFLKELQALPRSNAEARALRRYFAQSAAECDVDKQGRVTIPQAHREYAGITKELVTIGNIENIEVWSKEYWEKDAFAQVGEDVTATDINASEIAAKLEKFNF